MHNGWVTTPDVSQQKYPTSFVTINTLRETLTFNACLSVIGSFQLPNWILLFVLDYFYFCSSSVHYCEDCFRIHVFIRSSNIWLSYILSRLCWTVLQINVHERGEKEQKNDSINNPRPRVALDCEFESKRNRPAFGEKRLEATWPLRNMLRGIWHLYYLKPFINEGSKTYRGCYENNLSNNFFSFFWFNLYPRWHPLPWNKEQRVVKTS